MIDSPEPAESCSVLMILRLPPTPHPLHPGLPPVGLLRRPSCILFALHTLSLLRLLRCRGLRCLMVFVPDGSLREEDSFAEVFHLLSIGPAHGLEFFESNYLRFQIWGLCGDCLDLAIDAFTPEGENALAGMHCVDEFVGRSWDSVECCVLFANTAAEATWDAALGAIAAWCHRR